MSTVPPDPLASPCVRNCCLDEDNVCMGCGRSLDEIVDVGNRERRRQGRDPRAQPRALRERRAER